ncbi:MAG: efflux RND transporter periplasmic adaptor subunit [Desulfatiglandaceae bacterium]
MKKFVVVILLLAGAGLLGWKIYEKASASGPGSQPVRSLAAVPVEISEVKKSEIRDIGSYTGSLYPVSKFTLAPKISGRLEKMLVHIGDVVKPGQLVAALDDEEYRQQLKQAQAELEVSKAELQEKRDTLENARREYQRTVALREKKIASASQLDAAEAELKTQRAKLKVAEAQILQKEAAFNAAKIRLSYARIHVPERNDSEHRVVGERFVDEGALLSPNNPIVSILDIGRLIAVINVIERDYARMKPGLEAMITTDAFPERIFKGRLVRIAPLLKEKSRQARVEIEIFNEDLLLKPGMFVKALLEFDRREDATVIPVASIVKRNDEQGVFVADTDKKTARFVPVRTGIISGAIAEVLDPELEGWVVTLGHHLLEDGAAIILPDKETAEGPAAYNLRQTGKS